jgi:inhibitor of KinA sporulation pathway (predicted exonuclease)
MREADYYLVVDLEATCDDLGAIPRHESEIIEIGAVLVEGQHLRPIAEQTLFVRPILHPDLTPFCTQLTTITQDMVEDALGFPAAAARLAAFGAGALFCSWGAYDRNQLAADARRHGITPPLGPDHWNLKEAYAAAAGTRRGLGTPSALRRLGIEPEGTHHRGIDDARNIARMLPYLLGRPIDRGPNRQGSGRSRSPRTPLKL